MINQSFSVSNLRKIFDLENRKGNNIEKVYFEEITRISEEIKLNKRNIKKALNMDKLDPLRGKKLAYENEEKRKLKKRKEEQLNAQLKIISDKIINNEYELILETKLIKEKTITKINTNDPTIFFLLK